MVRPETHYPCSLGMATATPSPGVRQWRCIHGSRWRVLNLSTEHVRSASCQVIELFQLALPQTHSHREHRMKPSVGRIVLVFTDPRYSSGAEEAPAVITRIWVTSASTRRCFRTPRRPARRRTSVVLHATREEAIAADEAMRGTLPSQPPPGMPHVPHRAYWSARVAQLRADHGYRAFWRNSQPVDSAGCGARIWLFCVPGAWCASGSMRGVCR